MKNAHVARVITANDLLSGEVVYLNASGGWSLTHHEAELITDAATEASRLAKIQKKDSSVIGAYVIEVGYTGEGSIAPMHFREVFRTMGPSNRPLGKQAA